MKEVTRTTASLVALAAFLSANQVAAQSAAAPNDSATQAPAVQPAPAAADAPAPASPAEAAQPTPAEPSVAPAPEAAASPAEPVTTEPSAATGEQPAAPGAGAPAAAADPADEEPEGDPVSRRPASAPEDAPATLFDTMDGTKMGGFGGVGVMYTQLAEEDVASVCGEGALIFDHALTIGGGGCGVVTHVDGEDYGPDTLDGDRLNFGYGGLIVRYHFMPKEIVNVSVGTLIGAGGVAISNMNMMESERDTRRAHAQGVFVAEPQLGVYVNISRWLRFGASVGYRMAAGVVLENMSNSDLSGLVAGGTFHIGRF